jgi:hypothetical protein
MRGDKTTAANDVPGLYRWAQVSALHGLVRHARGAVRGTIFRDARKVVNAYTENRVIVLA